MGPCDGGRWPSGWRTSKRLVSGSFHVRLCGHGHGLPSAEGCNCLLRTCWGRCSNARHLACLSFRASVEVPVALETCWVMWEDRERIPQWMPWIKSVKVGLAIRPV